MANASDIFRAAHAATRAIVAETGGQYRAQFALCLKAEYAAPTLTAKQRYDDALEALKALYMEETAIKKKHRAAARNFNEGDLGIATGHEAADVSITTKINKQQKTVRALGEKAFWEEWTEETYWARKAVWNKEATARNIRRLSEAAPLEEELGFTVSGLRRAKAHYAA